MKKYYGFGIIVAVGFLLVAGPMIQHANAAAFNQNNIIDDSVFDDTTTMTAGQINAFLNTFPASCISPNSGFSAVDPIGYNPSQGYLYGGYVTAGQVIYDSAQTYGLNPQVLITTLEKEQSLVTGRNNFAGYCNNGDQHKYAAAVGYGCPDSGTTYSYGGLSLYARNGNVVGDTGTTCVNSAAKAGFSQQVIRAAWLLKFGEQRSKGNTSWAVIKGSWNNSDDPQSCYGGPMTQGTFKRCASGSATYFDGYTTIDSTAVHIDDGATAALYWYTPHFSGNTNFSNLFQGWFGSVIGSDIVRSTTNATIYLTSGQYKYPITDVNVWNDYSALGTLKYVSDDYLGNFTTGPTLGHMVGDASGTLYFVNAGIRLPFSSCSLVADYGYSCGSVITLTAYQMSKLAYGPNITNLYGTTNGKLFYVASGVKHEVFDGASLTAASISGAANSLLEGGIGYLGYSTPIIRDSVVAVSRSTGQKYYYEASKYTPIANDIAGTAAFKNRPSASLDDASIPAAQRTIAFSGFATNQTSGTKYALTTAGKVALTSPASWTATYMPFSASFLNNVPDDSTPLNNGIIKSATDATVYNVVGAQKRPIPSWDDLLNLHVTPLVINTLPSTTLTALSTGATMYAPGHLVKTSNSPTVYLVGDATHLYPITSFIFPQELGITMPLSTISSADMSTYTVGPAVTNKIVCSGSYVVGIAGRAYTLPPSKLAQYGFSTNDFLDVSSSCLGLSNTANSLGDFIHVPNGTIYSVQNGQKSAITNYAAYLAHGGSGGNTTEASDYFAGLIASGANITQ